MRGVDFGFFKDHYHVKYNNKAYFRNMVSNYQTRKLYLQDKKSLFDKNGLKNENSGLTTFSNTGTPKSMLNEMRLTHDKDMNVVLRETASNQ